MYRPLLFCITLVSASLASTQPDSLLDSLYVLTDNVVGRDFYNWFNWEALGTKDPTHGRVNYVDEETSKARNLTYASWNTFILRSDSKTTLAPTDPGRDSVRIGSKKTFTTHVAVFDIRHMPQGCGTWPAIWEVKHQNWPTGGEVDIVEGVNDQAPNAATLHTTEGCTMPENRLQTGTAGQLDCNWRVNYNTGCTVKFDGPINYGPGFNALGGGWYVMERNEDHISVWFWSRNDPRVPWEVRHGLPVVRPRGWGLPVAYFPNTQCDLKKYFAENNIIINLTFCGDWAGNSGIYAQSGCPSTCVDYVNNNPGAFVNAYFDFASIRVYQPPGHY